MKKYFYLVFVLFLFSGVRSYSLTVHTIGDSTMEHRDPNGTSLLRGWAQMLPMFWTDALSLNNTAKSGTSSMTFYGKDGDSRRFWFATKEKIKAGDYVFIQFGHNDEKHGGEEGEIGTNPWISYTQYLIKYVEETRELGAIPVLFTPVVRSQWTNGKIRDSGAHNLGMGSDGKPLDYVAAMKKVAEDMNCLLVDHTALTRAICDEYGQSKVNELIYNMENDGTHFGEYGATLYARLAVQDLIRQGILAEYLVANPDLLVNPQAHDFGKCYLNTVFTYPVTMSGFDLNPTQGKITVTVSAGFSIAKEQNGVYTQSLEYPYENGSMNLTTLYVRYAPETVGKSTGEIVFTYGDNSTKTIVVKGECISFEGGQKAKVYWELSANDSFVHEGPISVLPQSFSSMRTDRYAKPNANTTWEDGLINAETRTQRNHAEGGFPGGEIDIVESRYIQFGVTATKGSVFMIDSIAMYAGGSGTSGIGFRILGSKSDSFIESFVVGERGTNAGNTMYPISYTNLVELKGEETLYLRVYPWLKGGGADKSICLYGVTIKGVVTSEETGNPEIKTDKNAYCAPVITRDNTVLTYTSTTVAPVYIQVFSVTGQKMLEIKKDNQSSGTFQEEIDLSAFPAGIYFCSLLSDNKKEIIRIIKQ